MISNRVIVLALLFSSFFGVNAIYSLRPVKDKITDGVESTKAAVEAAIEETGLQRRNLGAIDENSEGGASCDCSQAALVKITEAYQNVLSLVPLSFMGLLKAEGEVIGASLGLQYDTMHDYDSLRKALKSIVDCAMKALQHLQCGPCDEINDSAQMVVRVPSSPEISHNECCCDVAYIKEITIKQMHTLAKMVLLNTGAEEFVAIGMNSLKMTTKATIQKITRPYHDNNETTTSTTTSAVINTTHAPMPSTTAAGTPAGGPGPIVVSTEEPITESTTTEAPEPVVATTEEPITESTTTETPEPVVATTEEPITESTTTEAPEPIVVTTEEPATTIQCPCFSYQFLKEKKQDEALNLTACADDTQDTKYLNFDKPESDDPAQMLQKAWGCCVGKDCLHNGGQGDTYMCYTGVVDFRWDGFVWYTPVIIGISKEEALACYEVMYSFCKANVESEVETPVGVNSEEGIDALEEVPPVFLTEAYDIPP